MKRLIDWVAVSITQLLSRLSWRGAQRVGFGLAALGVAIDRRKRGRIEENLVAAGLGDVSRGYSTFWRNLAVNSVEMLWNLSRSPHQLFRHIEVTGLDVLERAEAEQRGILLVSGHFGDWELVSLAAARAPSPVAVIARRLNCPGLERRLIDFRRSCGVRTIVRGEAGAGVAAQRWLARGGVLGCMMDRLHEGSRVVVPFLGKSTRVPLGPARLAHRVGAAVILGYAGRNSDGNPCVTFERVPTNGLGSPTEWAIAIAAAMDRAFRTAPEQWLWLRRANPEWSGVAKVLRGEEQLPTPQAEIPV